MFYTNKEKINLLPGKAVCVGRNYIEHAKELNNPLPKKPLLFIKPQTAIVALDEAIVLPKHGQDCQHEIEMAILMGKTLKNAAASEINAAILGYAVALDLTLRDVQSELKQKGQPWEIAKAFDGACPISDFIPAKDFLHPEYTELILKVNGDVRQHGNTRDMIFKIPELIAYISSIFTLNAGDIVLTGTPAGVGHLCSGDRLELSLGDYSFVACVD